MASTRGRGSKSTSDDTSDSDQDSNHYIRIEDVRELVKYVSTRMRLLTDTTCCNPLLRVSTKTPSHMVYDHNKFNPTDKESRHSKCGRLIIDTCKRLETTVTDFMKSHSHHHTVATVSIALASFEDLSPHNLFATSLQEISNCYAALKRPSSATPNKVVIFKHVDAFFFGKGNSKYTTNAIQQVASQFNFLESPGPYHADMKTYHLDKTQGPFASLGCPGALVARNSCYKNKADDLTQPFFAHFPQSYTKGYFEPSKIPARDLDDAVSHCKEHYGCLKMLAQKGVSIFGPEIVQVFAAAPSFQSQHSRPSYNTAAGQICDVLVARQYAALGQLAAIQSIKLQARIPLHVTLVGQAAFKNPVEVMNSSFKALMSTIKDFNVDVYFHGWSDADVNTILTALKSTGTKHVKVLEEKEFYNPVIMRRPE
jgi:hypothetical protein